MPKTTGVCPPNLLLGKDGLFGMRGCLFLVLFLVFTLLSSAAAEEKVVSVKMVGNRNISLDRVLLLLRTKPNSPFSETVLAEDIKRLMETDLFTEVVPEVKKREDGVEIILTVKEAPVIKSLDFSGNRRYKDKVLQEESGLFPGQLYQKDKVLEAKNKIEQFYIKKGLFFTEVELTEKETAPGEVALNFKIKEGVPARVRKVSFSGNTYFKQRQIEKAIKTRGRSVIKFRLGSFKEDVIKEDEERITRLYRLAGFADVKVESEVKRHKREIEVLFKIAEGKRYLLGTVKFVGKLLVPEEQLRQAITSRSDKPYSEEALAADRNSLLSFYRDRGYLKSQIEPVAIFNSETSRVDVTYFIEPGEIVEVEDVEITGNYRTKDKVIRREIKVIPGERFDGSKLKKSIENLRDLNYFEEVNVQPVEGSAPNKTKLVFDVKEKDRTGNLLFGLGYSTVEDLVGFIAVEQTNFDWRNPPSFVGGGQNFRLWAEFGTQRSGYNLSFFQPYLFDRPVSFGFDLYDRTREYDEFDENRRGGDLRFGWRLSDIWRISVIPRIERVEISDIKPTASPEYLKEEGKNYINSLTLGFTRDTRNSRLRPRTGTFQEISLKYAGGLFGGDKDFYKTEYEFTYYRPLPKDFVLSAHTVLAYADSFGKSEEVPVYERFFCGGARTVRGYEERSLGPLDSSGVPKGGNFLTVENIELTKPIYENILSLVLFLDIGQGWEKISDFTFSDLKAGIGAGLRFKVPIFPIPIKLDYGYALDPLPGEDPGRLHFTIDWWF